MNVRDITYNPPAWWSVERILEYFNWSENVVAGLRGVNKTMEGMFDESLKIGRKKYVAIPTQE
jgi:guanosine-3',5'-bis(diphosphate) 3'-pyrophosphohydrolase